MTFAPVQPQSTSTGVQSPPPSGEDEAIEAVFEHPTSVIADRLSHLVRHSHRLRARLRADAQQEMEWSANRLIATLVREGPMRMTALAAAADSDLSTVSRQVAELVRNELIERRPDPSDRRACLLAPTLLARRRYADQLHLRDERLARTLRHWSAAERVELARLLTRLTEDLQLHDFRPPFMDLSPGTDSAASAHSSASEDSYQEEETA